MANTTWKQVVYDVADAYREANGTTDKIPVGQLAEKVRAGAGTPYKGDNPLTIGQAGFTFPAKTLLKDGLQIINGVNGEDLAETASTQGTVVANLLKMVNRKVAENNGEGQYVWKKSDLVQERIAVTNPTMTMKTVQASTSVTLTTSALDCTKIKNVSDFLNGFTTSTATENLIGHPQITYSGGALKVFFNYSYSATITDIKVNSARKITLTIDSGFSGYDKSYSLKYRGEKVLQELITNDLSYVVSSDSSAYPNGSVHTDGKYYTLTAQI